MEMASTSDIYIMKAFAYHRYGEPEDVLVLEETEKPVPKDLEVRIKVQAISLNPAELHLMRATLWLLRLGYGLTRLRNCCTN
jgi:NADPH:quinone reductase-like Zn-dependent oxidoreductase